MRIEEWLDCPEMMSTHSGPRCSNMKAQLSLKAATLGVLISIVYAETLGTLELGAATANAACIYSANVVRNGKSLGDVCVASGAEPADVADDFCAAHELPANFRWSIVGAACAAVPCRRFESFRVLRARQALERWSIAPRTSDAARWVRAAASSGARLAEVRRLQRRAFDAGCCPGEEPDALWDALRATSFARSSIVAVDIGFNLGDWSRRMLARWPSSELHAFEASPPTLAKARESFEVPPTARVHWHARPVSNVSGTTMVFRGVGEREVGSEHFTLSGVLKPSRQHRHLLGDEAEREVVHEVNATSLDDFIWNNNHHHRGGGADSGESLQRTGIDLLKIDTEGWEPKVFQGAMRTLRTLRPTVVFFECHFYWEERHEPPFSVRWATELFERELGYDVFYVAEHSLIALSGPFYDPAFDFKGWRNCIALAPEMPQRDAFLKRVGVAEGVVPLLLAPRGAPLDRFDVEFKQTDCAQSETAVEASSRACYPWTASEAEIVFWPDQPRVAVALAFTLRFGTDVLPSGEHAVEALIDRTCKRRACADDEKTSPLPFVQYAYLAIALERALYANLEWSDSVVNHLEGHTGRCPQCVEALQRVGGAHGSEPIICEVGFNAGHSALFWLTSAPRSRVFSFDLGESISFRVVVF